MIGINEDNDPAAVEKNREIPWRSFADRKLSDGEIQKSLGISGIPVYMILDQKGVVIHWAKSAGPLKKGTLHKALEELLTEAGHPVSLKPTKLGQTKTKTNAGDKREQPKT